MMAGVPSNGIPFLSMLNGCLSGMNLLGKTPGLGGTIRFLNSIVTWSSFTQTSNSSLIASHLSGSSQGVIPKGKSAHGGGRLVGSPFSSSLLARANEAKWMSLFCGASTLSTMIWNAFRMDFRVDVNR